MRHWLAGALAAFAVGSPLEAQVSVRAGALRARYAGGASASAASIAPRVDWNGVAGHGSLEAAFSQFQAGTWAAVVTGEYASSHGLTRDLFLGLLATGSANLLDGGAWSGQGTVGLALGRRLGPVVASVGVAGGAVRTIADTTLPQGTIIAAVSARPFGADAVARVQRAAAGAMRWTDLDVAASRRFGRLSIDAGGGLRAYDGAGADGVWHVQSAFELGAGLRIEAGVGAWARSPDGFTDGLYASAGVRIASPSRSRTGVTIEPLPAGRARIALEVPGAARVAIAGDWNDWTPVPMAKGTDGRWMAELTLGSGAHRFVLQVDGRRQVVPRGVPRLPDGFGGEAGLLVIT